MIKHRLSFSLRTLLLAITAASIGLGILAHRVREQRGAVQELRILGRTVTYDFEEPGLADRLTGRGPPGIVPPEPAFLATWLGVDLCHSVVAVTISGEESDSVIRQLQRLPRLKTVYLFGGSSCCAMGYWDRVAENKRIENAIEKALPGVKVQWYSIAVVG